MYNRSLFWFRQDLRIQDNTGLFEAVNGSEEVLPVFILDSNIVDNFWGLTDKKFGFIREALEKISAELKVLWGDKVLVLHGKPEEIIPELVAKYNIDCIYTNTTYGSYWKQRDEKVAELCTCNFESHKDFLLVEPHEVEQRKVFTPFYKLWQKQEFDTAELEIRDFKQFKTDEQTEANDFIEIEKHPYFTMDFGQKRFEKLPFPYYNDVRNDLDKDGTSRLSPYLRFGVFSIRQLYNKVHTNYESFPEKGTHEESYISELAWREFWWQILYNFPNTKEEEFQEKRRNIEWSRDQELFEKWCEWKTGYPVVDAAMMQLNETNWMHGRARMIVASFLTKDMHIDWRLWEAYFKKMLLDYDEAVNLWNWQWWASVGADPKPLRIFNPILQSEKFDKNAIYIKKYLPEVSLENINAIHNPLETPLSYCKPIVDHRIETRVAGELYKNSDYENAS
jgi:deoxyribodipyrimidine photo-lyase